MEKVVETEEYQTLYENYLHVCSELTRMEAKNKNLKSENERLSSNIGNLHCALEYLTNIIVRCAKGGDD